MTLRAADLPDPLYALTWWQPWAWAMLHGKTVENRTWPAPEQHLGTVMAIHAGLRWDQNGWHEVLRIGGQVVAPNSPSIARGAIVGVARLKVSLIYRDRPPILPRPPAKAACGCAGIRHADGCPYLSPWFFGPDGWVFEDATEFAEPIPCRGKQRLWKVGAEEAARVRLALEGVS